VASPWLIARQVREAVRNDRPDEAHRLLAPLLAEGHRRSFRLAREVAGAHISKAERLLRNDSPDLAWKELLAAESLNTGDSRAAALRLTLARYGLAVVRAALEAGRPLNAIEHAERLRQRGVRHPELQPILEAAQDWYLAADTADRGDFLLAEINLDRVRPRLSCPSTGLDRFTATLRERHETFRHSLSQLHDSVESESWQAAIHAADEVLAVAPGHRHSRLLRRKAWERMKPGSQVSNPEESWSAKPRVAEAEAPERSAVVVGHVEQPRFASLEKTAAHVRSVEDDEPPLRRLPAEGGSKSEVLMASSASGVRAASPPKRFLLWVNNAGGFLVCLSPRVTFGQGLLEGPIDVPLLADVARLHAELTRDHEGYVIESQRDVTVNGRPSARTLLKSGDRVTLGPSCQFVFHRPSPMSPSARLEFVSGHHFPLAVCQVLLMAETLVIGPEETSHVCVPGLKSKVILSRTRDGLSVTAPGAFRVENEPCRDRAAMPIPGWVHGTDFGFGVELFAAR